MDTPSPSSYTNILPGVMVTPHHTRRFEICHRHRLPVVHLTAPDTLSWGVPRGLPTATTLSHPGSQTEQLPHTQTHPRGPPGPHKPGTACGQVLAARCGAVAPPAGDTPRPPAPGCRRAGAGEGKVWAQHLRRPRARPGPCHPGTVARWVARPSRDTSVPPAPTAGAGPVVRVAPLPPRQPRPGQPGRRGKSWGEPGFRLEPRLPVRPDGQEAAGGGQLRPSCPLLGTGSVWERRG